NTVNLTNATVAGAVLAQEATLNTSSSSIAVPGSVYCTLTLPVHVRTFTAFQEHDGSWPTAAYIATDGATVTGEVNAQACDFAVYVQPNAHVTIQNATIHDANQVGVFDDGAAVTLSTSTIYNIGDHVGDGKTGGAFSLGGTQTGFGIYVATSSTMTANGNTIYNYQKAGILARVLAGVFFRNNTITGAGPTNALAQIGVQLGFPDAVVASTTIGNFTGNTVTGNYYSPSTDAAGLLGSMVSGENATTLTNTASSTNTINNNQTGQDIVIF
ncbi:MAG TPA: right-handed parallel beta-helix repeat-containing protein, partial [Candidatus Paceibacterota bacterium]|nr:right-handed parallel beta-helix repeat-containing protein [Candidatus Paceibacterota bacterium]